MTFRNPYEVLSVDQNASADEIKSAYRRLAMQYHPDRNAGDKAAEERFREISEAYATLRDPASRERFDTYGSAGSSAGRPDFTTVDWQTVFNEADIKVNWDASGGIPKTGNLMFDTLFGVMTGMMRNSGLLPGETRELVVTVPVGVARAGGTRRVHVPGPSVCGECKGSATLNGVLCPRCQGKGALRGGEAVDLVIPAQVKDGARLRLKGLGGPGNPPGDALVEVHVQLPGGARLEGQDLYIDVPVTPLEATQGKRLEVVGVSVDLPAGIKHKQTLRVPGGGLGKGDLVVTVTHSVWQGLWRGLRNGLGFA